jgi:hypothetical protein
VQVNPSDPQLAYNVLSKIVENAWATMRQNFTKQTPTAQPEPIDEKV